MVIISAYRVGLNTKNSYSYGSVSMRKYIIIMLVLGIVLYFIHVISDKTSTTQISVIKNEPVVKVFSLQSECESATGKTCHFRMCDYIDIGKTFEEVCGKDFKKGWVEI
ncbi:MAG: hypothetical protein NTV72_00515 [Candidatus Taylorbacteria bacterium]|nr:hypothetical protein [Candidatus Taylorbacteria bacterium]